MANENTQKKSEELSKYNFLIDLDAKDLFAKLDYALRQGQHIQYHHTKQSSLFNFIYKNEESLKTYYDDFFQVKLSSNDADKYNKYYYLGFENNDRGMIRKGDYEYLDKKHILIGLVFWELSEIDMNYCHSLSSFYEILFNHDIYNASFLKLLANVAKETEQMYEDTDTVKHEIKKAFEKFESLVWIEFDTSDKEKKDKFTKLPAFNRLVEEQYRYEIENYSTLCKEFLDND